MILFPNAKINIGLHVIEKRADGYHNIETAFYPVAWCDVLEIIADENISSPKKNTGIIFKTTGIETYSAKKKNLCVLAYDLLKKDFSLKPVRMHLHKIIPVGAGLGGGSSDAAFVIKALGKMFNLNLSIQQMVNYTRMLGSDCTFFIKNKPAFATGRGDVLEPINLNLGNYYIVIIKPDININTSSAYSKVKPSMPSYPLSKLLNMPVKTWRQNILNDFEKHIFNEFPELSIIKQKLYDHRAVYASMSGSGSSIYGLFTEKKDLTKLFPDCDIWSGQLSGNDADG